MKPGGVSSSRWPPAQAKPRFSASSSPGASSTRPTSRTQPSRNFLVITPNIIVLDRVYRDFQGLRIFLKDDPILPDDGFDGHNWRDDFQLTLHVQDAVRVTRHTAQNRVQYDFVFVDEESFHRFKPRTFADLVSAFPKYAAGPKT